MLRKVVYTILTTISLISNNLFAQQCGYTNHGAIVLDIKDMETNVKVPNLSIALCDRDGRAITDYNWNCIDENALGQLDSFLFWENENPPKQKKRKCSDKFYRKTYEGIGDYYVCIVPTYTGHNDYLKQKRNFSKSIFEGKVADRDIYLYIKIKGKNIKEQILKIPSNVLYDICDCHLYATYPLCKIEPIRLNVSQGNVTVTDARFGVVQVNESESRFVKFSFDGEYRTTLKQVYLIDERSGNVLQTIPNRKDSFYNKRFSNQEAIKYFDAERYTQNVPHPRIMVPAKFTKENWTNEALKGKDYKSYTIYKFDEVTNRYIIDSVLSKPDFLSIEYDKINTSFNGIYGLDVQETKTAFIYKYYKFWDGQWQNPEEETVTKVVELPKVKTITKGVPNCAFYEKEKNKNILYFDKVDSITLRDTFYIYNYGNATAKLKKTYGDFFKVQESIKPNEKIPVYYNRTFYKNKQNGTDLLIPYMENVILEFDSNKTINAIIQFSIVNKDATMKVNSDGSRIFYLPASRNELIELQIDTLNNFVAQGKRLLRDSAEIGVWNYKNVTTGITTQKQFKKAIQLYINPEHYIISSEIYLIDKDGNKTLHNHNSGRNVYLYISENIVKIEVRSDSAFGSCDIDFKKLQQVDYAVIYLLKPSDNYYYDGKLKVPFNFHASKYHVRWQPDKVKETTKLQQLKDKFPKIIIDLAERSYGTNAIDLINCNKSEQAAILKYLNDNESVNFVSQLWQTTRAMYCDNRIYISLEFKNLTKEQLNKIESLGFKFDQMYYGHSEVKSIFKFNSKIVDDKFKQHYNQLVAFLDYPKCTLNIYAQMVEELIKKN